MSDNGRAAQKKSARHPHASGAGSTLTRARGTVLSSSFNSDQPARLGARKATFPMPIQGRGDDVRPYLLPGVFVCLLSRWFAPPVQATEPFHFPEGKIGKSELKYINGVPVLTVQGSPAEIGEAVGSLAVKPAQRMARYPEDMLRHYFLGFLWRPFASAGEKMVQGFPEDYRQELEAMAEGSGVARERVVVGNTLFDLKKLVACSALLVESDRSETGGPLLGRNLDYPSLDYAHEFSLVTVYKPTGARHAFVSIGFPGLVGCLSGMNDAGLSVAVLEVFQVRLGKKRFDSTGMPYALCYRRILEECTTIDEARELLESMKRTTTTNLAVADRNGIAVFEITPGRVLVRRAQNGVCVCTNHFCSDELKPFVRFNYYQTKDRYRILDRVEASREKLGLADLQSGLHAASKKDETMQTMVFEPTTLRLHLAIGGCPSSAGEMKLLELEPIFKAQRDE
jgi:isopenicillin-N N-acyltransferase like protein